MPVLTRERTREITETLPEVEFADEYLTHEDILKALENAPEVEYPKEVLDRLDRVYLETKAQMASGELKPVTVEELAAEYGITLD